MKIFKFMITLPLIGMLVFTGCTGGGPEESCSGVDNCDVVEAPAPLPRKELRVLLEKTEFYNPNIGNWIDFEFEGDEIDLGVIDAFSDNLGLSKSEAMSKVEDSGLQQNNPELYQSSDFNTIPYIKIKVEDNNAYLVNYQKINSQSMIQEEVTFTAPIKGDYAYIPFVNEQFKGKLQTTKVTTDSTLSFEHVIRIAATSSSSINDSIHKTIKFKLNPQTKLQGVKVEFSEAAKNFSLDKRWSTYFNGVDYSPNRDFDIVSLIDNQEYNEAIPYDVKVVFKQAPVLRMRQSVFVEEVIDLNLYSQTKEIFVQRGNSFIESIQLFDSDNHFQKKVKINGEVITLESGREGIKRNIPAGEDWKITFTMDFMKNQAYDPTVELLSPLRPMCQIINNQIFYPIATKNEIETLNAQGGKGIYCHPETRKKELIDAQNINSTSLALEDLWYDFFFYRPQQVEQDTPKQKIIDAGSFYGVRSVDFSTEGCLKIYIREASGLETNPNPWRRVSQEDEVCDDGSGGEGWTYFSLSKGDNIFNHRSKYSDKTAIVNLIEKLSTAQTKNRPQFHFNGSQKVDRIY